MSDAASGKRTTASRRTSPLRVDEGGAVRVGKSRVSLDLVVEQYETGMNPEDLVRANDTLDLADVHAVIAYDLRHRGEVRAYLKRREEEANALRAKIEAERPRVWRKELLASRSAREKAAPPTRCAATLRSDTPCAGPLDIILPGGEDARTS